MKNGKKLWLLPRLGSRPGKNKQMEAWETEGREVDVLGVEVMKVT